MKEKRPRRKLNKKNLLKVVLLSLMLLIPVLTYAAYTNQNSVKRVVSTQRDAGVSFSSNLLSLVDGGNEESLGNFGKKIFYVAEGELQSRYFTVCNYPQNDPTAINEKPINYVVTAYLVTETVSAEGSVTRTKVANGSVIGQDENGTNIVFNNENYKITFGGTDYPFSDEGICSIPQATLPAMVLSTDTYTITADPAYMDYINLVVTAVPASVNDYQATQGYFIARAFQFMLGEEEKSNWVGEFSDEPAKSVDTVRSVDGFNYDIYGSGKGTVTLSWNTEYVEISPWFLEDLAEELSSVGATYTAPAQMGSYKVMEFQVGDVGQSDQYTVQFYRVKPADIQEIYGNYDLGKNSVGVIDLGTDGGMIPYVKFSFVMDEE